MLTPGRAISGGFGIQIRKCRTPTTSAWRVRERRHNGFWIADVGERRSLAVATQQSAISNLGMNDWPTVQEEAATTSDRPLARPPLVLNRRNFSWITERISGVVEDRAPRWWWVCFTITGTIAMFGLF